MVTFLRLFPKRIEDYLVSKKDSLSIASSIIIGSAGLLLTYNSQLISRSQLNMEKVQFRPKFTFDYKMNTDTLSDSKDTLVVSLESGYTDGNTNVRAFSFLRVIKLRANQAHTSDTDKVFLIPVEYFDNEQKNTLAHNKSIYLHSLESLINANIYKDRLSSSNGMFVSFFSDPLGDAEVNFVVSFENVIQIKYINIAGQNETRLYKVADDITSLSQEEFNTLYIQNDIKEFPNYPVCCIELMSLLKMNPDSLQVNYGSRDELNFYQ